MESLLFNIIVPKVYDFLIAGWPVAILGLLVLWFIVSRASYLVSQSEVIIIERFGRFDRILHPGLHFTIPFIDVPHSYDWTFLEQDPNSKRIYRTLRSLYRIDLRESLYDFPRQSVITKDNVTMEINALLYYQITDPKRAIYEIVNLPESIEKLTQTKLREVIGSLDLDATLTSRDLINEKLRETLDVATDKWGVKVNRVELQEITPPADIRIAMEKQMRAERDRRAIILEAEGEKRAAVLRAEGQKIAAIEAANGAAEARRALAQGEADAIRLVTEALPGKDPANYLIAMHYLKTLSDITAGQDNKIVILPYEATGILGSLASVKEMFAANNK